SFAVIEDVLDPGPARIRASIHRKRSEDRKLELELPPVHSAVRLIRDPFDAMKRTPSPQQLEQAVDAQAFPVTGDGRRLLVRDGERVIAYPIAKEHDQPSAVRRFLSGMGDRILAAGTHKRVYFLITTDGMRIALRTYSRRATIFSVQKENE